MNRSAVLSSLLLLLACAGCASREHMSEDFGRQTRSMLAKQRAYDTPVTASQEGLDSEESAAIRDRYQQQLAPDDSHGKSDDMSRVLVIDPQDVKTQH